MPPLKNLEEEFPVIDANFQRFCASHNIFSVEDFLLNDLSILVASAEYEAMPEELKEGISQVLSIIDSRHNRWLNGVELLEDVYQNKHVIPTGYEGVDMLLGGGLRKGQLTELVGPSSSGKTQFCLYFASHVADKHLGKVIFLDSCNSFSPRRIAHVVNELSNSSCKEAEECRLRRIMSSILCRPVFDMFELLDVLHQQELTLKHQVKSEGAKICMLIVDSISSLVTPNLGGKGPHGFNTGRMLMVSAGYLLKKLANEHNLSVLVTNHMVGGEGGALKPALGESWKSIPHVRLLMSRDQGSDTCNISVAKHTFMASGGTAKFVIHN